MTLDFTCKRCDAVFEAEYGDMLQGEKVQCPNCDTKAPPKTIEEVLTSLDELMAAMAELRSSFHLSVTLESDELPPPYDSDAAEEDEDLEEEEDLDEDDDDDDDDIDENREDDR